MARKREDHYYCFPFHPTLDGRWGHQETKMFDVLKGHIKPKLSTLPLPDLLLFAYLLGLNHMQEVLDGHTPPASGDV